MAMGHYFATLRIFSELSTPFMNARAFIDAVPSLQDSPLAKANNLLFIASFLVGRFATLPHFWILSAQTWRSSFTQHEWMKPIYLVFATILDSLNIYWMLLILNKLRRMIAGQPPSAKR